MVDGPSAGDPRGELPMDPDVDDASSVRRASHAYLRPSVLALVFVGGVFGTLARYGVEEAVPHRSPDWPMGTFAVNVLGAFLLGLLLEILMRRGADIGVRKRARLLLGTGFCGAFTTYSTFALEAVLLTRDGHATTALAYGVATVVLGAAAAWLGIVAGASAHRKAAMHRKTEAR
ncbi:MULTISPECIES: fluoride efflux transporter CrcB [Nocardiaceae]|mgnify:FL=1|jgi:CrcB protein|uniref:fluoride efflux transporter CrcB n=1 Tax=Nocardiaceae TaxID=85025 RepID=UPI001E332A4C|nr:MULTISPECIES: fluoride efflux transporter CrcB [Rhodococcus]MCC8927194.1 fluoride efflux transporter CrcB [Rhodococcus sp. I2R]MCZ4275052.1 fluoride efflux transporter CrcB [Rhodococcus yunnanensis]